MAQEYYNLEKAAEVLGIYPADLNERREKGEVRAFRDAGNWKFKKDEIDALAVKLRAQKTPASEAAEDDSQDVLASELELGGSSPSSSGTVIGSGEQSPEDSDIKLEGGQPDVDEVDVGKDTGSFEELDLTIDEDVQLEDSQVALSDKDQVRSGSGDSAIDLAEGLEDDDLVLGGSGSGSDVTIGQDSGISLVDPHDSGLSLDEPLELASDDDSLALGEDDMLTLSEDADTEAPTELKADDDFLLTPLEEAGDEDTESGSQVIALDEGGGDEAATMTGAGGGMAAMLDEDLGGPDFGVGVAAPLEAVPGGPAPLEGPQPAALREPLAAGAAALPEAPYGKLAMAGLIGCVLLLLLSGMMAYDLVRNMWSWGAPFDVNSWLMDLILGLLPGG